jgi:alpha-tubulin suppressor-like RCC1 family protein
VRFSICFSCVVTVLLTGVTNGCGSSSDGGDSNPAAGQSGEQGGSASGGASAGTGGIADGSGMTGTSSAGSAGRAAGGGAGSGNGAPLGDNAIVSTARGNCVLDNEGLVQCWGYQPNVWSPPSGAFVELRASIDSVCAIRADRTFACFDPPTGSVSGTSDLLPTGKVRDLDLARGTVCGVDDAGQAFCNSIFNEMTVPTGESFSRVSVGTEFACGLRVVDGSIMCWGYGGDATCSAQIPDAGQLIAPTGAFSFLSSGFLSNCALNNEGAISCWGAGKSSDDPAAMCMGSIYNVGQAAPPPDKFQSVRIGVNHACGVKSDGTIACWGAGTADVGCPDTGSDCRQSRPPAGTFAQVSVGNLHSCAITADRKVQCWGYPGAGATGDGRLEPPVVFQ